MSLKPMSIPPVPDETADIARTIYPNGNLYMRMRDELGTLFQDEDFNGLFPKYGQPALAPWRLALVTVMQFVENLSDRQAADAVREKVTWKYALSLDIRDRGFNYSVLSEFRDRLVNGDASHHLLDIMLKRFKELGLIKKRGLQRTDATLVLAHMRIMQRLEHIGETLRAALNAVAAVEPEWLKAQITPEWFERYKRRIENTRLPTSEQERLELVETYGKDGYCLLEAIYSAEAPSWLREIRMIQTLRRVWIQHFVIIEGKLCWRETKNTPPSLQGINSPYETEARYGNKRNVQWIGYRVHLTETCEADLPHLIVNVETTPASPPDHIATMQIHASLAENGVLPDEHLMDGGYITAEYLSKCQAQYQVDIVGPVPPNTNWQALENTGFAAKNFTIDWEKQQITCPLGKLSYPWKENKDDYGNPVVRAHFSKRDCRPCPQRHLCTKAVKKGRSITMRLPEQHQALERAKARQETDEFKQLYKKRSGVEGTISQGVRRLGMRQCRYRGSDKSHLQHVATAVAMNILRFDDWLCDIEPEKTRISHFARLAS